MAKTFNLSYISVLASVFLELGIQNAFLTALRNSMPAVIENGDPTLSKSSLSTIGGVIIGVCHILKKPGTTFMICSLL